MTAGGRAGAGRAAGDRGGAAALEKQVGDLALLYGEPARPPARGPFAMVLWESVAYLQTDARHEAAFDALLRQVGVTPARIMAAPHETLLAVATMGGMRPLERVERLRRIAEIALADHHGDLASVLSLPLPAARGELMKYPGIGEPAAEKILVFCGARPLLALDSNGLRVLLRLGYGDQKKSYRATYRLVQEEAVASLPPRLRADCSWLARAHLLLRRHGRQLCKTGAPACEACPLSPGCRYARGAGRG